MGGDLGIDRELIGFGGVKLFLLCVLFIVFVFIVFVLFLVFV